MFRRGMAPTEVAEAIKNAVADATNSTTLTGHMAQCERDKAEMKAEQLRMHQENNTRFSNVDAKLDSLSRMVWIAMGAAALISIGGRELVAHLIH